MGSGRRCLLSKKSSDEIEYEVDSKHSEGLGREHRSPTSAAVYQSLCVVSPKAYQSIDADLHGRAVLGVN